MLTEVEYGTIRPPKEKYTSAWGDDVMNAESHAGKGLL
jgi:hypothetical protein